MKSFSACIHTKGNYTIEKLEPALATATPKLKDQPLSLSKKIWAEDKITWKLESDTPSIKGRNIEIEIFKLAFLQIGMYIPNKITQLNKSTADADIRINFSKTDSFFTSRPGVLAYAWPPATGIGGDITFNTKNYIWSPDGKPMNVVTAYDLGLITGYSDPTNMVKTMNCQHTGNHEGLHSLGVPHIEKAVCDGAMMNPFYNGNLLMKQCDIDYLQSMYGKTNPTPKQIKTLQDRVSAGVTL